MGANSKDGANLTGLFLARRRRRLENDLLVKSSPNAASPAVFGDWLFDAAAGGAYTLTAEAATYAVTGNAANTLFNRVMTASGAYSVTAGDATLTYTPVSGPTYTLPADASTYSLGGSASFVFTRVVTAAQATYTLGASANLGFNRVLTAETTNYAIAASANLSSNKVLTAESGSYSLAGSANFASNKALIADQVSYSIAGSAGFVVNRVLNAEAASFTATGSDATLSYSSSTADVKVSWLQFDTDATPVDVKVSWLAFDTSATPVDVKVSWICLDTAATQNFTAEVSLKRWYLKRKKKILLFDSIADLDAYEAAEKAAEEAVKKAQKTSRLARKRLREKLITVEPIQSVDLGWLEQVAIHFSLPLNLPDLIAQQEWDRVMEIYALALQMQDEEDVLMLLLA